MADSNTTPSPANLGSNASQSAAGKPRQPTPEKTPKKKRSLPMRMLRGLLWLLLALVVLLAVLLGGAWWWSGQDDSLARVIAIVQRYLPAEQKLQATDVRGSLRRGGSVGNLQWSNPSLTVDMSGATIGWTLDNVWDKEVRLAPIQIKQLTITPPGLEKPKEPTQPLEKLPLPLRVLEVPFAVDEIVWAAEKPITIAGLQGHYLYQGDQHQLQISSVQAFNGSYQAKATLGALAPMALDAQLQAHVEQPATETLPAIVADAKAHVSGQLSGADATLRVQAQLQPRPQPVTEHTAQSKPGAPPLVRSAKPVNTNSAAQRAKQQAAQVLAQAPPMQADVDATVYPWKSWPLGPTQASLQSINLAAFLPQLPTTLLSGELKVSEAIAEQLASVHAQHAAPPLPAAAADAPAEETAVPLPVPLEIVADLKNALPGPINEQRLPLSQLQAHAMFDGQRVDLLEGTALHVGNGSLQANGHYRLADRHAALSAVLQALNPALIDTRIDSAPLSGKLSAQSRQDTILFDADIRSQQAPAVRSAKTAASLPIERIIAKGQWKAPELQLESAQIDALGAHISANRLVAHTEQLSGGGQLSAQVPGATLEAKAQAAPTKGQGDIALKLSSAEQLLQWLRKLPGVAEAMPPALKAQGSLDAQLRFSGGYGDALRQLQRAGLLAKMPAGITSNGAQPFALDANISTPQLSVRTSESAADLQLRNTKLLLSGNLAKVQADLQTEARQGEQQFAGQLQLAASSAANQQWSGSLSRLQASATLPPNKKPWQLALQQPLDFKLQLPQGNKPLQASTGASQLQLTGPEPGTVTLQWNPLQFSQAADKSLLLQSTGTLQGLPLRWARAFQKPDANQNQAINPLDSDLVVQGRWDINTSNGLNAKLLVERASGDLRLHSQNSLPKSVSFHSSGSEGSLAKAFAAQGQTITAGIRTAQVELNVQDRQVQAQVRWDSANAGQLTADLQTALQYDGKDYLAANLAPDAPLSGSIKAQMPDLGIWASFAPPGWRVAGSLTADVKLSGHLQDPRWGGTMAADKMRIQSQLDGVDLRNGSLRAQLNGNELVLQNLHFDGGEGSRARIIGFSGNLTPAPTAGGTLDASGTIRWSMPEGGGKPDIQMDIRAEAKALQVLVRADRQVSVSGDVRSQLQQGQMSITGKLTVDRASIMLANESAPTLGSDVVVHTKASRAAAAEKAKQAAAKAADGKLEESKGGITTAKPLQLAVTLDLGNDFALQGYGITTRLSGALNVQNASGNTSGIGMPRITGEINTVEGRYRAWGQVLNVETGLIRFNGPYNNPSLDILALRPNIAVKAGVQVTGSAMAPRVNLYSDPVMPDAEKISWVVMGRDPAGGGANSAMMQQAALALLGGGSGESLTGNIAQSLGLDEIGFGGDDANGGSLSLGKRLSKDLYVTYEAGLAGTLGALYIFYDFTRNLQLRGSAGTTSALDLIYTLRYE
ncbi:translocation/assembly module TamB domain-containing protein [Comamonas sp. J-3]|uniref:translocation/assembly module TamB domain-containing protein n=1 Tax=Comamonas trifloxystrobinivorans TaxID=3350256 RepID=UPI003728A110